LDEQHYAIATDGQEDVGDPVPYGEIATLTLPDGDVHYVSYILDPEDEDTFKVYETSSFPAFSTVPCTWEDAEFDGASVEVDDDGEGSDDDEVSV
jgi:hypothetical protein